jgi:hypothetical protein
VTRTVKRYFRSTLLLALLRQRESEPGHPPGAYKPLEKGEPEGLTKRAWPENGRSFRNPCRVQPPDGDNVSHEAPIVEQKSPGRIPGAFLRLCFCCGAIREYDSLEYSVGSPVLDIKGAAFLPVLATHLKTFWNFLLNNAYLILLRDISC